MRNDQIAVLLRDFARRALEWASVLEKQEPGDPVVDRAFIEHGTFSVSIPTDPTTPNPPTGATTPDSSNVGNGGDSLPVQDPLPTAYVTSTPFSGSSLKRALQQRSVPEQTYRQLLSYAATYAPWHVFRNRNGVTLLSVRTTWTDAEITEALR